VARVVGRRIIHEVLLAILDDERRPKVLRLPRPRGLVRKRVAEELPVDEVERLRDLDVDPLSVAQRLGRIGIIAAVRREDDRGIGEVRVEDRIEVSPR
jgi:hypothetical protein